MYVNEPSEKAHLPELDKSSLIEQLMEKPRNYHDYFWDDQPVDNGREVGYHGAIHAQVCRFNSRGEHVIMAKDCPHFEMEDESGRTIQNGWTVQQNASNN